MNKRGRISIWDVCIWIGIILILVWAILKSFGVIHSPIWMDMIPYYGIAVSAVGAAYKIGRIMKGIEFMNLKVNKLLNIEQRFSEVENIHNLCIQGKLKHRKLSCVIPLL